MAAKLAGASSSVSVAVVEIRQREGPFAFSTPSSISISAGAPSTTARDSCQPSSVRCAQRQATVRLLSVFKPMPSAPAITSVSQTGTLPSGVARTRWFARNESSVMRSGIPRNAKGSSLMRLRASSVADFALL